MSKDENLFWFHGKISRERAEEILKEENQEDGTFLVRESNTALGDFVLSVLYNGDVCHYQIRRHGEDAFFSIDDKIKIMHGLESLVDYYREGANGLVTKLTQLVKKDLPPNDSRSHGTTNLLHRATQKTNQTVVSELLKCGYRNVDAKNQDGQTAVHLAAIHSTEEILKLLLNANVNVNCMDSTGNTPLHYACRTKSASFVRTLIAAKANIQVRNITSGYVPLHDAASHGNLDAVKELIAAHAPHLPRTESGEFPIDLAKEMNRTEVVEFLSNYKPPPASTFKHQWYHGTLERQEAVDVLLEYASKFDADSDNHKKDQDEPSSSNPEHSDGGDVSDVSNPTDKSGIFLVRMSNRHGLVLTMLCQNNTLKHFLIKQSQNCLYIDEGPLLPSIEHLVEHFSLFSDGLPINLKHPVPPKPKPPLPLFSTMPKSMSKKHSMQQQLSLCTQNFSHPGDDAMNRVGLFENDVCILHQGAKPKKPKLKEDLLKFGSLKPAKKIGIIDGWTVKSLRKVKVRSPSKADKEKLEKDSKKKTMAADDLQKAGSIMNNLSFSTDFLHSPISTPALPIKPNDSLYNVPQNNSIVPHIEPAAQQAQFEASLENVNSKTEEEVEYFTKNDVLIDRERGVEESDYFVDAPPPINMKTFPLLNSEGYVPTQDIRKFIDMPSSEETTKLLEESAAELREFSMHPERLDSVISTTSNDSEFKCLLNRQISSLSAISENSRAKLNYFIPKECLELEHIIGEGEFGSVYKGFLIRKDPISKIDVRYPIAIKTLRDEQCRSNKQEFLREASVMIRLKHHCIVQLIGISKGKSLMMLQEMVPLGSMLHFIIENATKINPNCELKIWASQIACGMNYLESQHFVHRDLAARNILLASRNQAKISDFGLSRAMGKDKDCYQATQGGKWPIKWYAPESYNNGYFSHASDELDVWSFGVTLWEMFSLGDPPYGDIRGVDAIELIESGQRLQQPLKCPDNVYKIMENCWNYKPKDRPTFRYLTDFFANDPDYQNLVELIKSTHIS